MATPVTAVSVFVVESQLAASVASKPLLLSVSGNVSVCSSCCRDDDDDDMSLFVDAVVSSWRGRRGVRRCMEAIFLVGRAGVGSARRLRFVIVERRNLHSNRCRCAARRSEWQI